MKELLSAGIFKNAKYTGFMDEAFSFVQKYQLLDPNLWARFVNQFREDSDSDGGWRGEFWGKMMRGASLVYKYSKNKELLTILKKTVCDMIASSKEDGRISTYPLYMEFDAWDIWGRKYVLLGMEYFLEICDDADLRKKVIESMCTQTDYIISKIGKKEDGKKEITLATRHWRGANSASVLEPIVKLYNLTGEKRYFDFAKYIADGGFTDVENLIDLAFENELNLYQYPVTKAYEVTSCFEGLIEFYKITGEEKYKIAIINYADKLLENEFSVIGCCGCTHELFDHTKVRQSNTTNGDIMQETCVTVTIMKFLYRVHLLTGDAKYADAFETSLYNAYLGSFNTEQVVEPMIEREHPTVFAEPLPFDSYSPLTAGTRGNGIGGFKIMSDNHYYGCCACIGSAGIGLVPEMQVLKSEKGIYINLYIDGMAQAKTPSGKIITLKTETDYPKNGKIKITVNTDCSETFEIALRNPCWSKNTSVFVCDEPKDTEKGYIRICREWQNDDAIELELDMRTEAIYPVPYGSQVLMNKVIWGHNYVVPTFDKEDPKAKNHLALRRGPIMLAAENRLGYCVDDPLEIKVNENGFADAVLTQKDIPYTAIVKVEVPLLNGENAILTDYSSAGKLRTNDSKMAVWIKTKE